MSALLTNATLANLNSPYYSGGGGPGGGPVVSTSQLLVSSINTLVPGAAPTAPNGFDLPGGANIAFVAGGGGPDIQFTANNGTITGLSSINGQPVSGAAAAVSTPLTTKWIGAGGSGGPQALNSFLPSTTVGKWYTVSLGVSDWAFSAGTIAPGDHIAILGDTTVLGTLDLVQASTLKGAGQPYGQTFSGPVVAGAGGLQISAYSNTSCAVSTFLTCDFAGWVQGLN
jgi:hypothetical protein